MADLLASGMTRLAALVKSHMSESLTARRGTRSSTVTGRIESQPAQAIDQDGLLLEWSPIDVVISTTDLPFGNPENGDRFETASGQVFQVHPVTGTRCYTQSTKLTRIHCKKIK